MYDKGKEVRATPTWLHMGPQRDAVNNMENHSSPKPKSVIIGADLCVLLKCGYLFRSLHSVEASDIDIGREQDGALFIQILRRKYYELTDC